jgi:hypothetical protein
MYKYDIYHQKAQQKFFEEITSVLKNINTTQSNQNTNQPKTFDSKQLTKPEPSIYPLKEDEIEEEGESEYEMVEIEVLLIFRFISIQGYRR